MDENSRTKKVEALVEKAVNAPDAAAAVNFAQAACNAANALRVAADIERGDTGARS